MFLLSKEGYILHDCDSDENYSKKCVVFCKLSNILSLSVTLLCHQNL